ncbi:small T antigen [Mus musculus polyomavirus 3]|uniref:Small t antigen n=1 Tax=Mus musculus polyomavirus 3 TaxID=2171394 RepID=A0A2S0SZ03_9POLY|nr:small T antigen [Mus musculus polyomavirus 3]AWB14601.1 small T antigen [Mus musculus polyomavirus 3]
MELLGLHMACWGNVPLMRKAFLEKAKEYHPDKGGDENKMKRLNTLYRKLEEKVHVVQEEAEAEAWDSTKVHSCDGPCCDPRSLVGYVFGEALEDCLLKQWECVVQPKTFCKCIHCYLERLHAFRYKISKIPVVWLRCYCFTCYCKWFGKPKDPLSLHYWKIVLMNSQMGHVGL